MKEILGRSGILSKTPDKKFRDVPLGCKNPEGLDEIEYIRIKAFSGETRRRVLAPGKDGKVPEDNLERLLANSICDESGNLIFTEEDIPRIAKLDAELIDTLAEAIMDLNGIGEKSVKDLKGELKPTPK